MFKGFSVSRLYELWQLPQSALLFLIKVNFKEHVIILLMTLWAGMYIVPVFQICNILILLTKVQQLWSADDTVLQADGVSFLILI